MTFKKGDPRPPNAGRKPGQLNKATIDVRAAIARFAEANVEKMGEWLDAIPDPQKKLDIYLRVIEYHIPKLSRSEVTGADGKELDVRLQLVGRIADALGPRRGSD